MKPYPIYKNVHYFRKDVEVMGFNRSLALEYVKKYWDTFNPEFQQYENDCTNFVSQCWNYAGIPMTIGWHGGKTFSAEHPGYTNTDSWVDTDAFYEYMTHEVRGATPVAIVKWSSTEVNIGDVVQFWNPGDQRWSHAGIITATDGPYGMTYGAHTDPHLNKPLSDVYPKSYTELRFICPVNIIE